MRRNLNTIILDMESYIIWTDQAQLASPGPDLITIVDMDVDMLRRAVEFLKTLQKKEK